MIPGNPKSSTIGDPKQSPLDEMRPTPTRRFAAPAALLALLLAPSAGALGQLVTIGDLPPGKTVTVTYRSTVANLSNGLAPAAVSSQGTVSGTNFTAEPTDDPGTGANDDATVTLFDSLLLSDQVWEDLNGNGTFDGSPTDALLDGVGLSLFVDVNTNNVLDGGDGAAIASTSTAGGGLYSFSPLLPGNYLVRIDPANFGGGGSIPGYVSVVNVAADPDNDVNNDDNGVDAPMPSATGIASLAITLAHNSETTNDPTTRLDINDTLDFGVVQLADVEIVSKTDSPDPVTAGENLTYTISFRNNGPSPAVDVEITDAVPAGTTFVSATPEAGWGSSTPAVGATGNVVFSKASVASGETATFTFVVEVDPATADGAVISNTATATTASADPDGTNDAKTATTDVVIEADVELVSLLDSPDPVLAGQNISYTVNFRNNGPSNSGQTNISFPLPPGTTFVSLAAANPPWGSATPMPGNTGTVTLFVSNRAPGEMPPSPVITVKVDPSVADGTVLTLTGTATPFRFQDPDSTNNEAVADTTVAAEADLAITKTDDVDPVAPGGTLVYTVSVENLGPSDAQNVVVTETLPAGVTFVETVGCGEDPAGAPTCSLGTVAGGATAQYTVEVTVDSPAAAGLVSITNQADVSSSTTDPVAGNDSATEDTAIAAAPDLTITKDDGGITATPGSVISWALDFENKGNQNATGVKVVETVPANTTFNEAASGGAGVWSCADGAPAGTVCEHLAGSLSAAGPAGGGIAGVSGSGGSRTTSGAGKGTSAPGPAASSTVTFAVTVDPGVDLTTVTEISNTATVEDDGANGIDPVADNSSTDTTPLAGDADLAIALSQSDTSPAGGAVQLYQAVVGNNGPDTARDVAATVQLPPLFDFLGIVGDPGTTCTVDPGNLVTCDLGDLAASDVRTTTIGARIDPRSEGVKTVASEVTGTVASDPVPGNETSDVMTSVARTQRIAAVEFPQGATTRRVVGVTLREGDESVAVGAYDAPAGTRLGIHVSGIGTRAVDIVGIDDVSGVTGSGQPAADFAVVSDPFSATDPLLLSVIDADTQALEGSVGLAGVGDLKPIGLAPLPDFAGAPSPELAVLVRDPSDGLPKVAILDAGSLALVRGHDVGADPTLFPLFVQGVPDFSANLAPEVAVAVRDDDSDDTRVIVLDGDTGAVLGNHSFGPGLFPLGLSGPVDGAGPTPELALLVRNVVSGALEARVFDPATGGVSALKLFDPGLVPGGIEALDDFGGTPAGELAVMGRDGAAVTVEVRDADPLGALVSVFSLASPPNPQVPLDFTSLPDLIDTPAPELAVLSFLFGGDAMVQMVDAASGTPAFSLIVLP